MTTTAWTEAEDAILIAGANAGDTDAAIAARLPGRSRSSVIGRRTRLSQACDPRLMNRKNVTSTRDTRINGYSDHEALAFLEAAENDALERVAQQHGRSWGFARRVVSQITNETDRSEAM